MQVTTFAISEAGERDLNEDAYRDADLMAGRCVAVADGAGGHRGASIASRLAVETLMLNLAAALQWNESTLIGAVTVASQALHSRQQQDRDVSNMSSTIVVLCLDAARRMAQWTHMGDSRVYYFDRQQVQRLTRDHSVLQSFTDAGFSGSADTVAAVNRSVLYAALGAEGGTAPIVGTKAGLNEGDAFLLCTDGVWDSVTDSDLARLLTDADSVTQWVQSIRDAVADARRPSQDNYTAVGVWIGAPGAIDGEHG